MTFPNSLNSSHPVNCVFNNFLCETVDIQPFKPDDSLKLYFTVNIKNSDGTASTNKHSHMGQ